VRALSVAANADRDWLPQPAGRALSAIAMAVAKIEDLPLSEALNAANLWAAQTG
jgi:hypothetical protein